MLIIMLTHINIKSEYIIINYLKIRSIMETINEYIKLKNSVQLICQTIKKYKILKEEIINEFPDLYIFRNIIYSPIGTKHTNDMSLLSDTPFWGYKDHIGKYLKQNDIVLLCYGSGLKIINYIGRISFVCKNKLICNKVWSKDSSVNSFKRADKSWNYIVFFDKFYEINDLSLSKEWIRRMFGYKKGWKGQSPLRFDNYSKKYMILNKLYRLFPDLI